MSTEADMIPPPAITISRSLGSGGTEVGLLVARKLGWQFCDRRILRRTAEALGVPVTALARQEERPSGLLEKFLSMLAFASPEVPYAPPLEVPVYSAELFEAEGAVMRRLADAGPSVLVGRGGFIVLKDRPSTFHVRIEASLDSRIRYLLGRGKAPDEASALKAIQDSDRGRAAFFRRVAHVEWEDPANFQLVLDTGEQDLEACAGTVVRGASVFLGR